MPSAKPLSQMPCEPAAGSAEDWMFALFDQLNDAVFVHDAANGQVLHVNRRAEEMYGLSRQAAGQFSVDQISLGERPYSGADAAIWLQRAVHGEQPVFEWQARHLDGHLFWVEVSLSRVAFPTGVQIVAFVRDIGDRRAQRRALEESEARLRTVFETSNAGIFIADAGGRLQVVNRRFLEMFRGDDRGIRALSYAQLIHPDHRAEAVCLFTDLMAGRRETSDVERHYRRVDGTDFWGLISGRRIVTDGGVSAGLVGIIIDVSERRRIEAALVESEERLSFMVEYASDIFCLATADLNFRYVSPVAQALTGYAADELAGPIAATVHPEDWQRVRPAWQALFSGEADLRVEYRHIHVQQEYVWVEALARRPQGRGGMLNAVAVSVRDISARKAFEDELQQARIAAEAATRAKSAFLANTSHEIRTPMNAILGLAHLLEETLLSARQAEYLATLKVSTRALQTTVNDLLDFSKIEAGKLELEHIPFNLDEVLEELACVVGVTIGNKPLEIVFEVSPDVPRQLVGDPLRLEQVLSNLCNNAIKFTERGRVHLHVSQDTSGDGRLHFAVVDTGMGIDPSRQDTLFQPFSQLDSSTTRRYGGTGLGLAICHRLVELMGGRIRVLSTLGEGSHFSFSVRLSSSSHPDAPVRPLLAGKRVVVAEARDETRRILVVALQELGAEVDARAVLHEGAGSCEIADIVLVDTAGWAAFRDCPRRCGRCPPVVVLLDPGRHALAPESADDRREPMPEAAGFLLKPVTGLPLRDTLAGLLGNRVDPDGGDGSPPLAGLHVLVVDDSPIGQLVVQELLVAFGARVSAADSAAGAIAIAAAARSGGDPLDLVLMDLQMPEMDGYGATALIRAQEAAARAPRVPIVALSANALVDTAAQCLAAGMDAYLAKPVDVTRLCDVVRAHAVRAARGDRPELSHSVAASVRPVTLTFQVPGVHAGDAMLRVNGDAALFQRFLGMFVDHYAEAVDSLIRALAAGDRAVAGRLVHDVVGVASTLGARRLTNAARVLQAELKAGRLSESSLDEYARAFVELLEGARRHRQRE